MMKAILIDPFTCTVTEVEHDGELQAIYDLLTHETMQVRTFEAVRPDWLAGRDVVFVDEEGLLKEPDRWFVIYGNGQPLAGKGLVIGADEDGDTTAVETKLAMVRRRVVFLELTDTGLYATDKPWVKPE